MSDLVHSTVGDYHLEEFLGAGGMGEVYRGVHTRIGRVAAVKILTVSQEQGFTDRFLNEARIQAELNHPNIATLYEFTEFDGRPCIIMEYIDGVTLADQIRTSARIRPEEAVRIILPIVQAVGYIHGSGIIHRDIKSHNIKISSKGTVKLLDFGIARGAATPRFTKAGQFVGTLHYCSPEQLRGEPVDHRSDIWALGILFYEMLVGQVPFDAPSVADFIARVERVEPRLPSELISDLPRSIDDVVCRCLEKRPGRRYQSAEELAGGVESVSDDGRPLSVLSRRRNSVSLFLQRGLEFVSGHGFLAAGMAVVLLIVIGGLALVSSHGSRPTTPADRRSPAADRSRAGKQSVAIGMVGGKAEVWVDDRLVGATPCRFEATVGSRIDLELKVNGYRPLQRTIEVLPHSNSYTYSIREFESK